MCQHIGVEEIEKQLNKDFENVYDQFDDTELSTHFGEDKAKSIFASKCKNRSVRKLDLKYKDIKVKQQPLVIYLGCVLDGFFFQEPMNHKNKIKY